jgi:DNA-binding IclR family transcriptional regulator
VTKSVRVLVAVAASRGSVGISEIARRAGPSKSTVHTLVSALAQEGLLARAEEGKGYLRGPLLVELGGRARDQYLLGVANLALQYLWAPRCGGQPERLPPSSRG